MAINTHALAAVGVDPVIFTVHDSTLKVLLHQREKQPFLGKHELPGGLMHSNETAEQTLRRKLSELIDGRELYFTQFYTFTKPTRDPRARTVSIGFIALVESQQIHDLQGWHDYAELPPLAFDHREIILKAREYLRDNVDALIVKQFMPSQFPLNALQAAYEIVEGVIYDNRNFRKKILGDGIVEETDLSEEDVSHRPAKLYRFRES